MGIPKKDHDTMEKYEVTFKPWIGRRTKNMGEESMSSRAYGGEDFASLFLWIPYFLGVGRLILHLCKDIWR